MIYGILSLWPGGMESSTVSSLTAVLHGERGICICLWWVVVPFPQHQVVSSSSFFFQKNTAITIIITISCSRIKQ